MKAENLYVCPWWLGYFLINPLRKYYQNPEKLLKPFVKPGMKVLDYGCAMGYFSLPLARLVGETGKVYAIDIQEKMISSLIRRAGKAGLSRIIDPVLISEDNNLIELNGQIDFALLFAMVHEVPDKKELFSTVADMAKPDSRVLFAEPRGHVSPAAFEESLKTAKSAGFEIGNTVKINGSHAVILRRSQVR